MISKEKMTEIEAKEWLEKELKKGNNLAQAYQFFLKEAPEVTKNYWYNNLAKILTENLIESDSKKS